MSRQHVAAASRDAPRCAGLRRGCTCPTCRRAVFAILDAARRRGILLDHPRDAERVRALVAAFDGLPPLIR